MGFPKIVLSDIDGVWTDGGMYYDQTGNEWKKFNTKDSAGVLFCHRLHVPVGIITGEHTEIVTRRAAKLSIDYVCQGAADKVAVASGICARLDISLNEAAFIGDDIADVPLLRCVGVSACPSSAPSYIKKVVGIVTSARGGDGAFREFVETLLIRNGIDPAEVTTAMVDDTI